MTNRPDVTPHLNRIKGKLKSMMVTSMSEKIDRHCASQAPPLTGAQCNCVRLALNAQVAQRIDTIRLHPVNYDSDVKNLCEGYAANGYYEYATNSMTLCPITVMMAFDQAGRPVQPGYSSLMHTMAHELGHSMDPRGVEMLKSTSNKCKYTTQEPNTFTGYHEVAHEDPVNTDAHAMLSPAYRGAVFDSCGSSYADSTSHGDHQDAQCEIAADGIAAELLTGLQNPQMSDQDLIDATAWMCGTRQGGGHPPGDARIRAFANAVRRKVCPSGPVQPNAPSCPYPR